MSTASATNWLHVTLSADPSASLCASTRDFASLLSSYRLRVSLIYFFMELKRSRVRFHREGANELETPLSHSLTNFSDNLFFLLPGNKQM